MPRLLGAPAVVLAMFWWTSLRSIPAVKRLWIGLPMVASAHLAS